jgi:hypothetical protein
VRDVAAVAGGLLAVLLPGCGQGATTTCPAVAYLPELVVELDGGCPPAAGLRAVVGCGGPCTEVFVEGGTPGPGPDELTVPLATGSAHVPLATAPDEVTITVLAADGEVLTEVGTWRGRVGGNQECGGPMRATVTVPAPCRPSALTAPARDDHSRRAASPGMPVHEEHRP